MIRVTVELVSPIDGHREVLGTAVIANDGSSETEKRGNYNAAFFGKRTWLRQGRVKNFPRKNLNVWHLIRRSLNAALEGAPTVTAEERESLRRLVRESARPEDHLEMAKVYERVAARHRARAEV